MTDFHASLDAALAHQTPPSRAPIGTDGNQPPGTTETNEVGEAVVPGTSPIFAPLTPWQWLVLVTFFYALPVSLACWWVAGLART